MTLLFVSDTTKKKHILIYLLICFCLYIYILWFWCASAVTAQKNDQIKERGANFKRRRLER